MGVTRVYCSLFEVIKHMSTAWYVYVLTSTCPPQLVTGQIVILQEALIVCYSD